jgi:hypothetical protein
MISCGNPARYANALPPANMKRIAQIVKAFPQATELVSLIPL